MGLTAADLLVDELKARGVPFIATLNGHGLNPLYLACEKAGMRLIDVRNEQAASYMAEITGRLTRTVGVCAVSGAVAHANALTGVLNAWFDGAPMLLITGITPLHRLGFGDFQDFNPVPMAAPICKFARLLDVPERVPQMVHEAYIAATSGHPGPVHLALPIDVAETEVDATAIPLSRVRSGSVRIDGHGDPDCVDAVVERLKTSHRPLIVAGSGIYYSKGENALRQFSEAFAIPVVVPVWDRGSLPDATPNFLGVVGAASGDPGIPAQSDLIIAAGTEFDYRVGQFAPPAIHPEAVVTHIHADTSRLRSGLEVDISILGSPANVLNQLCDRARKQKIQPFDSWLSEARHLRETFRNQCEEKADSLPPPMNGRDVVRAVRACLEEETVLLVDGGNIGQWFNQLLEDRLPGNWITCGASGVIGWGLPGAMAARALYPDRPVILLSGDGSFTFTVAELECASRQQLPFVAVVADDEEWGITVTGQETEYGYPLYSKLGPTRLDLVAEGFGCHGIQVETSDDLIRAIQKGLNEEKPTVIQVPVVPSSPSPLNERSSFETLTR